jgi:hypothetical protein
MEVPGSGARLSSSQAESEPDDGAPFLIRAGCLTIARHVKLRAAIGRAQPSRCPSSFGRPSSHVSTSLDVNSSCWWLKASSETCLSTCGIWFGLKSQWRWPEIAYFCFVSLGFLCAALPRCHGLLSGMESQCRAVLNDIGDLQGPPVAFYFVLPVPV